MTDFKRDRMQHTEILMRYDEVLMEKASKFNLAELREDVVRNYVRQGFVTNIDKVVHEQKELIEKMQRVYEKRFDDMNQVISQEISTAVKKGVQQMTKRVINSLEELDNKSKGMG